MSEESERLEEIKNDLNNPDLQDCERGWSDETIRFLLKLVDAETSDKLTEFEISEQRQRKIEALESQLSKAQAEINAEPPVKTLLPDEFQRLWHDCLTLSEKSSFKSAFKYLEKLEASLKEAREGHDLLFQETIRFEGIIQKIYVPMHKENEKLQASLASLQKENGELKKPLTEWICEMQKDVKRLDWLDKHASFVADSEYVIGPYKVGELRKMADDGIALEPPGEPNEL